MGDDAADDNHAQRNSTISKRTKNELELSWDDEPYNIVDIPFPTDEILLINNQDPIKKLTIFGCPHQVPSIIFDRLTDLEELHFLTCSNLDGLPSMNNLCKMEILKITACVEDMTELPQSICSAPNLKRLELLECFSLNRLPEWIGQLSSLTTLSIAWCAITSFPASIVSLNNLSALHFYGDIDDLPREIGLMTGLQELSIRVDTSNLEASTRTHAMIQNLPNLKELRLGGPLALINSLTLLPQLKKLELEVTDDYSRITIFDGENGWKDNSSLEQLFISYAGNIAHETSTDDQAGILRGYFLKTLRKLYLKNLNLNRVIDDLSIDNHRLPEGLVELDALHCSRNLYSEQEKLNCIRNLLERNERLCSVIIDDTKIDWTNPPTRQEIQTRHALPLYEAFLLKFNRCGRILVQSNEGTTVNPIPISVWPTVLARVQNMVARAERWKPTGHDEELEASILFRLLQGDAFLGRNSITAESNTTARTTRKRKCFN